MGRFCEKYYDNFQENERDTRGIYTKNFFGGVWGNRPPLMEKNQFIRQACPCSKYISVHIQLFQ